jgi:hypothetical protein
MSVTFFAMRDDVLTLLERVFAKYRLTAYEAYSAPGAFLQSLPSATETAALLHATTAQIALWFPEAMPQPSIERIDLEGGSFRWAVRGCGLFRFSVGILKPPKLTASHLSWFTEAGARAKCRVTPGPDAVAWLAHKRIGTFITGLVRRTLCAATVSGRPVLTAALGEHRSGLRLVEHLGAPCEYQVPAT